MTLPEIAWKRCNELKAKLSPDFLCVMIAAQKLNWFRSSASSPRPPDYDLHCSFDCSTSKFGIGQQEGTNRTPLGLHRIKEKIGDGESPDTVFKGRVPVGTVGEVPDPMITCRILWLDGLEAGFNRGGDVDTHARYVYIHGTGDESRIGRPDSHGCVHLRATDLVNLFDAVPSGTLVWIQE
ncbi:MAG: hypothetical protein CMO80_24120 [Verrucomicrobiales bacterium]|nr:hypothetical protein [Verrucomicrobiales bacterium]|tara:strand:- start:135 stop:677 length:543 start_codon:yes stop_codon:yes gene_type:complete